MKHEAAIKGSFALFYESWMNDEDKAEMDSEMLMAMGKTMEELDAAIEAGEQNGYPVAVQLKLIAAAIKK